MPIDLSIPQLIAVNVLAWLIVHLGVAWIGTRLPVALFNPRRWLYRPRAWEGSGRFYERAFRIKSWKHWLPDGAALFAQGFRKANLREATPEYLERFAWETCRGEGIHWVVLMAALTFFLWNPWWAGILMIVYGLVANLPCILVQRYNRLRLTQLVVERRHRTPKRGVQ